MLRIKQERLSRVNWTLDFVGEQLGLTGQAISLIETGKRKPSFDVLVKLENLFGLNYRDLFQDIPEDKSTA